MPTIYNYSYYPEHVEALEGFTVDNKYVEYKLIVPDTIPEKYSKIAAMAEKTSQRGFSCVAVGKWTITLK